MRTVYRILTASFANFYARYLFVMLLYICATFYTLALTSTCFGTNSVPSSGSTLRCYCLKSSDLVTHNHQLPRILNAFESTKSKQTGK